MTRIVINSRVSTECWRFDKANKSCDEDRWSFLIFGKKWCDGRLFGTVMSRAGGDKFLVEWDIDGTQTEISTEFLCKEDDSCPKQG